MLLSELVELVKIESGQHEMDLSELAVEKYKLILEKRVLPVLNKHMPYSTDVNIDIVASPYIFTTAVDTNIPTWISRIVPVGNVSATNIILRGSAQHYPLGDIVKSTFLWNYDAPPKLYLEYTGDMLVTACYNASLVVTDDEDYNITLFNEDAEQYMISLLAGHAMVALGRGRRSAKILDLPIEMDTDALIAEGQELIRETLDEIKQNNAFYLALGE
jgi:hypothetical protein